MIYTITIDTRAAAFCSPYFQQEIPRVLANAAQVITGRDYELIFRQEWILRDLNGTTVGKITCQEEPSA
jgi:hypothetical protein